MKPQSILLIFLLFGILGCVKSQEFKIPSHYRLSLNDIGSSAGSEWSGKVSVEVKGQRIVQGQWTTTSVSSPDEKTCTYSYVNESDICWRGVCNVKDHYSGNVTIWEDESKCYQSRESDITALRYSYESMLVSVNSSVAVVKEGRNPGGYGPVKGQEGLPAIYAQQEGCNEMICIKNGYITFFTTGSRYQYTWNIDIIEE